MIFSLFRPEIPMPTPATALPGRKEAVRTATTHYVNKQPLKGPYPDTAEIAIFGAGCFWGVERKFWNIPGVIVTAVGYAGGYTPNPTYEEVCSGHTGHTEAVLVVFDPAVVTYDALLKAFWEAHDPTQGNRQGNDTGTQYRSAIYTTRPSQAGSAARSRSEYQSALNAEGYGEITTEIGPAGEFYFAEDYHQQYLAKNPGGYCGVGGTGVSCPVGSGVAA
ncbi:peptide methionine sulfoxide reductase MsrA 1 [Terrihabitans soli]|uniref:Peptide methionine sulfoxide reductase MsrA n=1 Tax=Terrihabitans soli TaxID=708113 RepID=A0A6S6QYS3_9HYPH|nr:peptide-methionine (S)-S-oxide reductase MsrA [Terrihabitans soli]BCJ92181.1 peptide methionine sulfoxide reductase MsrA 1 [Terrihabitans soli]